MQLSDMEERYEDLKEEFQVLDSGIEEQILLDNKRLDECLINQIPLQRKWERFFSKLLGLYMDSKTESERAFGQAYTEAISDSYKAISSTDAKHIAMCDEDYVEHKRFENKVFRLKRSAERIVDLIESRKYILKDLSANVINGTEKTILG